MKAIRINRAFVRLIPLSLILLQVLLPGLARAQQSGYSAPEGPLSVQVCMTCHGTFGQGSPVVGGPNLTSMEPWYLKHQLESFRTGYRGEELDYIYAYEMRKTAEVLTDDQIAELVAMISAWPATDTPETIIGNTTHGQTLYQPCAGCHGIAAEGNELLGAPGLNVRNDWYLLKQLKLFKSGFRGSHPDDTSGGQMRLMMQGLATDADMVDVIAYINSLD